LIWQSYEWSGPAPERSTGDRDAPPQRPGYDAEGGVDDGLVAVESVNGVPTPEPPAPGTRRLIELRGAERERAVPIVIDSFTGIYRWHAKRTLREIETVRAVEVEGAAVGVSMVERLLPEVGYVYYLAVLRAWRHRGIGRELLDDALGGFARSHVRVVYAAAEEDNETSLALFRSRGFREVGRSEPGFREGGLGAWGLRSRMRVVSGEVLLGRRLAPEPGTGPPAPPPPDAAERRGYPPTGGATPS
jgi:ribosomal protein S18 acetylase RimI-like enzyme